MESTRSAKPRVAKSHDWPMLVAGVFNAVALLVLLLGLGGSIGLYFYLRRQRLDSVMRSLGYALPVLFGGVLMASALSFFGFVLDLLVEIADNTGFRYQDV